MEKSMNIEEKIDVMDHAWNDGKVDRTEDGIVWELDNNPVWDWECYNYRVHKGLKHKIDTMQAFARGEQIESIEFDVWKTAWHDDDDPVWDWDYRDYRVKL